MWETDGPTQLQLGELSVDKGGTNFNLIHSLINAKVESVDMVTDSDTLIDKIIDHAASQPKPAYIYPRKYCMVPNTLSFFVLCCSF